MRKYLPCKSFVFAYGVDILSGYTTCQWIYWSKTGNKYLIFDDYVNENKELLKKYTDVWDGIKNKIKAINGGKENNYRKDYMKIKFNSDDYLPLNKPLKFHAMTIIIRSVFEEGGKLYPPVYLDDTYF